MKLCVRCGNPTNRTETALYCIDCVSKQRGKLPPAPVAKLCLSCGNPTRRGVMARYCLDCYTARQRAYQASRRKARVKVAKSKTPTVKPLRQPKPRNPIESKKRNHFGAVLAGIKIKR